MTAGQLLVLIFGLSLFFQASTQPLPQASLNPSVTTSSENVTTYSVTPPVKAATPNDETSQIIVARAIDGDTIELSTGQRVRYIGIDTPESVDPRTLVQCFGVEAAQANRDLVQGQVVRLEKDVSETDRYGRLLRYVWVGETLVNDYLVRNGYARSSSYPPDIKYQEIFRKSEAQAQAGNLGMWTSCSESTPKLSQPTGTASKTAPDPNCMVKGNISSGGKIYHVPGGSFYDRTIIDPQAGERWFCTETEAQSAGWRKSKR